MITSSQLYDLLKAKKQATSIGKLGGHYYTSTTGAKVYVGKKDPHLAHILALTPHSGDLTQGRTGPVEVEVLPPQKTPVVQRMKIHSPHGIVGRQSAGAHIKEAMAGWPAFVCRNCGTSMVPSFPSKTAGDKLLVQITKPSGATRTEEGYDPEAAGKKLCPECSAPPKEIGREVQWRDDESKVEQTEEDRARAKARVEEDQATQKKLQAALAKTKGKRTPEEQQLVDAHEAKAAVSKRVSKQHADAERRQATRKQREEAKLSAEENEALANLRDRFRTHLLRQGVNEEGANQRAEEATPHELAQFQSQVVRESADRAEQIRQEVGKEVGGKRIPTVLDLHDIAAHYERRRLGLPSGEERGVYRETFLNPGTRRVEEEKRTERLRERMAEKESGSKIKKSLVLWIRI